MDGTFTDMSIIKTKVTRFFIILAALLAALSPWTAAAEQGLPITGKISQDAATSFASTYASGRPAKVTVPMRVSAPGLFSFQIVQQPSTNPAYVSTRAATVTQFSLAYGGTIGLLAHNFLAGAEFTKIQPGQEVTLNFPDGRMRFFTVSSIHAYQALSPNDPYSDYIDLQRPGKRLTSTDVFNAVYRQGDAVVFQTCIARSGNSSWGRLFITARPFNPRKWLVKMISLGFPRGALFPVHS